MDSARELYAKNRKEMRTALESQEINLTPASGGFNVWITPGSDEEGVAYALAKKGWLVRLGSAFDVQCQSQAIRVTVSKLQEGHAQRFAQDLKSCLT
jgi:DNA-binding transcriptional MocR family regulator